MRLGVVAYYEDVRIVFKTSEVIYLNIHTVKTLREYIKCLDTKPQNINPNINSKTN